MSTVIHRVDERLVHGQVCVGWVPAHRITRMVVADAQAAADGFETEILGSAAPAGVEVRVIDPSEAPAAVEAARPTLVLFRSLAAVAAYRQAGGAIPVLNLGGLHYRDERRRFMDFLYLSREDLAHLARLDADGIRLEAQDVPAHAAVHINPLIAEGRLAFDRLASGHS